MFASDTHRHTTGPRGPKLAEGGTYARRRKRATGASERESDCFGIGTKAQLVASDQPASIWCILTECIGCGICDMASGRYVFLFVCLPALFLRLHHCVPVFACLQCSIFTLHVARCFLMAVGWLAEKKERKKQNKSHLTIAPRRTSER